MLDAADGFSTSVVGALQTARTAMGEILAFDLAQETGEVLFVGKREWKSEVKEPLSRVADAVDATQAKSARVHLLFGDETGAGIATTEIVERLRQVESALGDWPHSVKDLHNRLAYDTSFGAAIDAHAVFNRLARHQIRDTWRDHVAHRVLRRGSPE